MDHYYIQTNTDWIGPVSRQKLIEFVKNGVVQELTVISFNGKTAKAMDLFGKDWHKFAFSKTGDATRENRSTHQNSSERLSKSISPPPPPENSDSVPGKQSAKTRPNYKAGGRNLGQYQRMIANRFQTASGLLDIFDWKFEKYVTPIIVRFTWVVCVLLAALVIVLILLVLVLVLAPELPVQGVADTPSNFNRPSEYRFVQMPTWFTRRVFAIGWAVGSAVGIALSLLWTRALLETLIVVFNIASSLSSIDRKFDDSVDP